MKRLLLLFVLLCYNFSSAQSSKVLRELGVDLELNKTYDFTKLQKESDYNYILQLNNNRYFKDANLSFTSEGKLFYIKLNFKSKKVLKANQDNIIDILKNYFGDFETGSYTRYFKKELESADFTNYDDNVNTLTGVLFRTVYAEIKSKYDEFENLTVYNSEGNYYLVYDNSKKDYMITYKAIARPNVEKEIYMIIDTENKDWLFLEEMILLIDNERFNFSYQSQREVNKRGNTTEKVIINLGDDIIDKLLKAAEVKIRLVGKAHYDMILPPKNIYGLKVLKEYFNK